MERRRSPELLVNILLLTPTILLNDVSICSLQYSLIKRMQSEPISLDIIHFNDVYNIEPNKNNQLGFLNFYSYIQQLRKQYPQALLVFSGDCYAPSKLSRVFKGEQMAHCINQLDIDVACYGNHEFDFGIQQLYKLVKDCTFPWLLGNIKYKQTGENLGNGLDYHIITRNNLRIGFLGLAGPDFNGRMISEYKDKLKYINLCDYARQVCKTLKNEGCQLIIALTHCRKPADIELANAVPQIDIILGGHDHHVLATNVKNTPIIKSGSDFQYVSLLKIGSKQTIQKPDFHGKRWNFEVKSLKVPKAQISYPHIQDFINQVFLKRKEYDQQKALQNNPVKQKSPEIPKSDWLIDYKLHNGRPIVSLRAGLSAEVCLAKYIAFKRQYFYSGYNRATPPHNPNYIDTILEYIYNQYKIHRNTGKTALYSPGICNVPYLLETCNFVYLPSHFLVGVTSIANLQETLAVANKTGHKCYAVVGYDPFFKNQLCAWIKFIQAPLQYLKIVKQLKISSVVIMSVHDRHGTDHGAQRNCRLIAGMDIDKPRQVPQPGDIYMNFILQNDEIKRKKEIDIFGSIISDRPKTWWNEVILQQKCNYIHDWESGIDCIDSIQSSFQQQLKQRKLNYHLIAHRDSWNLYLTAYHLGKAFIQHNYVEKEHQVVAKGIVFNQYFMSNPTYELNYGYIPILYWQFYPKNEERILSVLSEEQKKYKRWFNNNKGVSIQLVTKDSNIINTDNVGKELVHWTTKHAPKQYKLKYLPLDRFLEIMKCEGLLL